MRLQPPSEDVGNVSIERRTAEPESNVVENASEREDTTKDQHSGLGAPVHQRVLAFRAGNRSALLTDNRDDKPDEPDDSPKQAPINQRNGRTKVGSSVAKADDHEDKPGTGQNCDGNRDNGAHAVV